MQTAWKQQQAVFHSKLLTQWITNEMQALSTQAIKRAQQESNDSHKWQFNQMPHSCLE